MVNRPAQKLPYKAIIFDYDGVMTTLLADLMQFPKYSLWRTMFGLLFNKDMRKIVLDLKKRGFRIILLSNTVRPLAFIRKQRKFYDLFDEVFLSYEIGIRKPSAAAFETVLKSCNLKPKEALFVDDRLRNVRAAQLLGMDTIHARNYLQLKNELCQKVGCE